MYYPYFRGKQYELITIRESAPIFAKQNFVPIIEPVREQLSSLEKTLRIICHNKAKAIVVVNPQFGDHRANGEEICSLLNKVFSNKNIIKGVLLTEEFSTENALNALSKHGASGELAIIHSGFSQAKDLASKIKNQNNITTSIFLEDHCGKLYRRHFANHNAKKVLVRDGFQQRRNRDHPEVEFFSDLHATYKLEGVEGFGDFLIVGDDFSETGGPAYTIAIHLTFIDHDKDDEMHIHHFKSVRQDTPKDPAGKFAEALTKLIQELEKQDSKIEETAAVKEFCSLHVKGHFPGLGYVKKLSMKHHIEILSKYLSEASAIT